MKPGHVSLERALSKLGIASRTQARAWIEAGQVKVNGVLRKDPGFPVVPEKAKIEVEGRAVARVAHRTFLLHKPRGVVTTRADEKGRPTVFGLLEKGALAGEKLHLIAIGRLDLATTGLLLLTNDTRLSDWLTDPATGIRRTYVVSVRGEVTEEKLARLQAGIVDAGERLSPDDVTLRKASGKESHLVVSLREGKNREIRRLFLALGHEVTKLKRVAFGPLELGSLAPGDYRELSGEELRRAFPDFPARG